MSVAKFFAYWLVGMLALFCVRQGLEPAALLGHAVITWMLLDAAEAYARGER